jgi:hypothetical protein
VIFSSVVAKSEARRLLIIAHGMDKLGSIGVATWNDWKKQHPAIYIS